jgi:hypothetical protein
MKHWHTVQQVTAERYLTERKRHPTLRAIMTEVYRSDTGPDLDKLRAELAEIKEQKARAAADDEQNFRTELFRNLVGDLIVQARTITRKSQEQITMENRRLGERILGLED